MTIVLTKLDPDGTPSDQDCPECGSENSVALSDTGLWKCDVCSTIISDQASTEASDDNLYVESLGDVGRLPNSCRKLGDGYWRELTEQQLLDWVELVTFSLQEGYSKIKNVDDLSGKTPLLSFFRTDFPLIEAIEMSEDSDGIFHVLSDDNHPFWDEITWMDLKRLVIWALGRLLDKELIKGAKANAAAPAQQVKEIQTKRGRTFRFPVKIESQGDNLYVESLLGIGKLPDQCRELGDNYWARLTEMQLLSWVEAATSSLQTAYSEDKETEANGGKVISHPSLTQGPHYILLETINASNNADGTFDTLRAKDVDHFFWDGLTWDHLKWLVIWAIGRLLDKELIKEARASVASPDF